ncbi:MAG: Fe-S cluster assembly ATPase SufC [Acidimicrobiaceae bacterium]|nr:Fe-S cluster assembly ATPase SufC [Acidimicrobiaceae bacterium]
MSRQHVLRIENLHASVGHKEILRGIDLQLKSGEVHAVMGPNGSGKSTLSHVLMGKPGYEVTRGSIFLDDTDLLALPVWERAQAGLFLVSQYPIEVPGVSLEEALRAAFDTTGLDASELHQRILAESDGIRFPLALLGRSLNVDFSGGEKKRNEMVQLAVLKPKFAVLDEIDSGLDIDALRDVSKRVEVATNNDRLGVLAITHYSRLLKELRPDRVHVLVRGEIAASGGPDLAEQLEKTGYAEYGVVEDPGKAVPSGILGLH